jgi:hypothetical protein
VFEAQFKAQAQQAHVLLVPHVLKAQMAQPPMGVCRLCRMRCAAWAFIQHRGDPAGAAAVTAGTETLRVTLW